MQEARKQSRGSADGFRGNQYTELVKGQNEPLPKSTAQKIAEEVGVSESTVKRAEKFSKGIDTLEKVSKEAADKVLRGGSGVTKATIMELPRMEPEKKDEVVKAIISNIFCLCQKRTHKKRGRGKLPGLWRWWVV